MRFAAICLVAALLLQTPVYSAALPPVKARHGMIVTSESHASEIGLDILKNGGNAVDAAIAVGFALAVTLPTAGNIGGGGFMLVRTADGDVTTFDFREKAPILAHERMFLDANNEYTAPVNHEGYLSIGVPGTVAGFFLAHERFGQTPMGELIEPAIRLADEGFPVTQNLHDEFKTYESDLKRYPETAKVFFKGGTDLYEPGELLIQPDLAESLRRIQLEGRAGFYESDTARYVAEAIRRNGGMVTEKDFERYRAVERPPVQGTYRSYDIYSMGPPSSGGTAIIQMLNILEGYNLTGSGPRSTQTIHLLAEAMHRAFRDRARYMGDPDFNPDLPLSKLLSKDYATVLRWEIDPVRATPSRLENIVIQPESGSTTHYSVVDAYGNAVAVTYTLEEPFGSKIVAEGTGFLLNNEMGDFNPEEGLTNEMGLIGTKPNLVGTQKRMLSSMSPTLVVRDNKPFLIIGTPGGRTIINTVLQVIVNVIDFGMDISEAVAEPRIHHQWFPDLLYVEKYGLTSDVLKALEDRGHLIHIHDTSRSQGERGAMGIVLLPEDGTITGASDPRTQDGLAVGY